MEGGIQVAIRLVPCPCWLVDGVCLTLLIAYVAPLPAVGSGCIAAVSGPHLVRACCPARVVEGIASNAVRGRLCFRLGRSCHVQDVAIVGDVEGILPFVGRWCQRVS